jgi:hypothetical protein
MKSSVFLDTPPCSPLKDNQRFGGTSYFHLQGHEVKKPALSRYQALAPTLRLHFNILLKKVIFISVLTFGIYLSFFKNVYILQKSKRDFSLLSSVQTGSVTLPISYPVDTRGSFL